MAYARHGLAAAIRQSTKRHAPMPVERALLNIQPFHVGGVPTLGPALAVLTVSRRGSEAVGKCSPLTLCAPASPCPRAPKVDMLGSRGALAGRRSWCI